MAVTPEQVERNRRITEEFRASAGKVGGAFEGRPMLLLTTTGAKTGERRTTPLVYLPDGDDLVIIASKGGSPEHPAWYHNLVANPAATVEVGTESFEVEAEVVEGQERDSLYARQAAAMPAFADYERRTTRKIPVVRLRRTRG